MLTFPATTKGDPEVTVRATVGTTHVAFSLRTYCPSAERVRQALATAYVETVWARLRETPTNKPDTLTTRQAAALGGVVYRALVARYLEEPRTQDEWAAFKGLGRVAKEGRKLPTEVAPVDVDNPWRDRRTLTGALRLPYDAADHELTAAIDALPVGYQREATLEARYGRVVDDVLAAHGMVHGVDYESRDKVLRATHEAATAAAWRLKRAAGFDFTPDPAGEARWPSVDVLEAKKRKPGSEGSAPLPLVSWQAVFEAWSEAHALRGGAETTRRDWATTWRKFAAFTGVSSPLLVGGQHVRDWRDMRLKGGAAARTVYDADLTAIRGIFSYAIRERLLGAAWGANPAADVRAPKGAMRGRRRMGGYGDTEVATLLRLAAAETATTKAGALRYPARRWVPWLCALTGSRVSTMLSLRACDVKGVDGVWCIEVTSEAGPVKTDDAERVVPLHPAIVEQGFVEWVRSVASATRSRPAGPLFYTAEGRRKGAGSRAEYNPAKGAGNSLRKWVLKAAKGAGIEAGMAKGRQPLHAFRHWIKTALREVEVQDSVIDAIVGHAPATVGGRYGRVTVKTMAAALGKLTVDVGAAAPLGEAHGGTRRA